VGRVILDLTWLPAESEQDPIGKRRYIWNTDDNVPADGQDSRYFVTDPEDLLQMLIDLIRNHQIDGTIAEGQAIPFEIQD
jgi:hypothetical protein